MIQHRRLKSYDNTDNQDLTLSGNTLNLSGDPTGGVDLSYLSLWERNATTNKLFPKNIGDNVGIGTNDPLISCTSKVLALIIHL